MKAEETVGKCKHCGDPIYRFQVVAHDGCVREYEFNPDYLDFQKGVEAGRITGKQAGMREVVDWLERCKKIKVPKYQLKEWGLK